MLDQRVNEIRVGQVLDDKDCVHTVPPWHKKNTVKELLLMKRQKYSQDNTEHQSKIAKYDSSPPPLHPAALNTSVRNQFPSAAPEISPVCLQQDQHAPVQGAAGVRMSLFQWQIQQEAQRVGGLSAELLNMQDSDGDTFLHIAVAQGKRALTFVLAAKMANCGSLDVKEHNGQTALQLAAAINQPLIVQDLLGHGAQVNTRDLWGRSPLHVCAEKGHFLSLQSIWRTLMGSGQQIDIDMHNYDGLTPLHAAVLSHNAVIREHRGEGNSCSQREREQLQRRHMYVECVKALLLMGASCGAKDPKSGRTCLHMAAEEANVELLHIFLNDPSSLSLVNVKTFSGNTALHVLSSLQNRDAQVDAVKLLMRKGADPGVRNLENDLPSQLAPEGPVGEKVRKILKGKYCHA